MTETRSDKNLVTAGRVVVGVDASARNLSAVEWAVRDAQLQGRPLHLLGVAHVGTDGAYTTFAAEETEDLLIQVKKRADMVVLDLAFRQARARGPRRGRRGGRPAGTARLGSLGARAGLPTGPDAAVRQGTTLDACAPRRPRVLLGHGSRSRGGDRRCVGRRGTGGPRTFRGGPPSAAGVARHAPGVFASPPADRRGPAPLPDPTEHLIDNDDAPEF